MAYLLWIALLIFACDILMFIAIFMFHRDIVKMAIKMDCLESLVFKQWAKDVVEGKQNGS